MSASNKPSFLVEQKRVEAIISNKHKTVHWEERKKAHEETQKSLKHYAGKLKEQIMVPIGKRGMMKGRIVNTNQVFVSIGSGWFTKVCSAEAQNICSRRISECKEMLEKLEKEKKLLEGWTALSANEQIFPTDDAQEIIEPYDEKEEKAWREKHAEKVKEHKKKLAEVREQLKETRGKVSVAEDDLWKRLELLELQEEFEDELHRLGEHEQSESDDDSSSLDSDDYSAEEDVESLENENIVARNTIANSLRTSAGLKESKNINFDVPETPENSKRSVKRVTFENSIELSKKEKTVDEKNSVKQMNTIQFGDIIEHTVMSVDNQRTFQENRPVSKFKSSKRQNNIS